MSALAYSGGVSRGTDPAATVALQYDSSAIDSRLIVRIEGRGNYAIVYTKDDKPHLFAKSLCVLAKQLPTFWRVHKSHLINPYYVAGSVSSVRAKALLRLTTGYSVPVSRRQRAAICAKLNPLSFL
ncbi:LytTR family DNA-binding domain-containing protein [Spirosoma oryzicola]|uniref:LytTR family DNA-binding domain-containing protein n=1 Tax=Spirosoma oryzicola TaxID=2898794 RepID=UPI001E64B20D|nr:LytTR family DNA-binding domain-containing protein [Spirosoma oryzicola]UHG93192.1 LytTR family transcriptional regulator [Spirosoma oryzicola]